jgi:hypothetical protein
MIIPFYGRFYFIVIMNSYGHIKVNIYFLACTLLYLALRLLQKYGNVLPKISISLSEPNFRNYRGAHDSLYSK